MVKRTVCLCDGKLIGIESIYTVVNGHQINIQEKVEALRKKSRNNELFCPCGCGANLILIAGERNLKEQHFRLKAGSSECSCHVTTEGKESVDSKIVLKCWLDEKLDTSETETRVPICSVGNTERKYEFSFLCRKRKIAVSYCHEKSNLSDEKLQILEENSKEYRVIYITNAKNKVDRWQYPELLMKVQKRQGYCLLLDVEDMSYDKARMEAVFYEKDIDGYWKCISFAKGSLKDYFIDEKGNLLFGNDYLDDLQKKEEAFFLQQVEQERKRREEKDRLEQLRKIEYSENLKKKQNGGEKRVHSGQQRSKSREKIEYIHVENWNGPFVCSKCGYSSTNTGDFHIFIPPAPICRKCDDKRRGKSGSS